ncbi:hypothetical protein LOD99_10969 [Oopsacas minuta]|uniref:Hemicentin-1-like von Willebrand factor A domain-containing protein n=1 Tax=Oopsacas minuta TaxID=111878 RepID=A0AAV7KCV6_9METZ|nr:hypothetical protein LOD99_10969 [Oopsacas minuta]
MKSKKRIESNIKQEEKKRSLLQYFLRKIENRKMIRGKWDREKMKESDHKMSQKFASDFLLSIQRGVETAEQSTIEALFKGRSGNLTHTSILLSANERITTELNKVDESIGTNNFIVQYICNRNEELKKLFQKQWEIIEEELYYKVEKNMTQKFLKQIGTLKQILTDFLSDLNTSGSEQKAFDSENNFELADLQACKDKDPELLMKARESPFKAMVSFLRMYLDPKVDEVQIKKSDTYILCKKHTNPANLLDEDSFKRLTNTKMFNSENIFNISEYIEQFLSVLNCYKYEVTKADFREMTKHIREEFEKNGIGCPAQCPSCGKLCEREIHPNDGKCQLKTGHQICSMGGKVWNNDGKNTAVLLMCDDYKENTKVILPGQRMNWGEFKEKCENEWDWMLPKDEKYVTYQQNNREKMKEIWNKFGRGILEYHEKRGTKIKYIPYISSDEVYKTLLSIKYYICFVIDGTGSMCTDIERARISVNQFIKKYKERGSETEFKVVIYRDHCDSNIIEKFPNDNKFTSQHKTIQNFLETVKANGGGDYPEAVLDGLATAATQCDWKNQLGARNILIHIYDAPPHGDFPNYESHYSRSNKSHCCCCNHGTLCNFDWERDVWANMHKFQIQYHGITTGDNFPGFEAEMKKKLGDLCGEFQKVGKEQVNDAILQIFIKCKMD